MTSIAAATSALRGDGIRDEREQRQSRCPVGLVGAGRRVGSVAVAGVRRWRLAVLARHSAGRERRSVECARGLRRAGDARVRHPSPARRQSERPARRSRCRCGDRARTRAARSAGRNDRRLQPGDGNPGDRRGRTRVGRNVAVSDGSSHQLQRSRLFHRPARRRRAVSDRRRRPRQGNPCGRVHRRGPPRRHGEGFRRRHSGRCVAQLFQQIPQRVVWRRHRLHRSAVARGRHAARRLSRAAAGRGGPARRVAGRRHRSSAPGRPGSRHLFRRWHRARDRLSPAAELPGLRHHRPPLEFGGRRMARRHGDASDLRHSGNVGPACTQPSGNAAVATAARYAGAAAGRGSPPRSGRGGAAPIAEDGSGRSAHRRHRARLQQPPDGDQQQHRTAAATAAAGQRLAHPADRCGDGRRAARRDADASAARVLAAAAIGTGADRCQPAGVEHVRPAASDVGRTHRDRDRARRWTVADAGRCEPARERAAQPRGERARRDASSAAG